MSEETLPCGLRPLAIDVWAWSVDEPTRLLTGTTVRLGADAAVMKLPKLAESATRITLASRY